MHAPRMVLHFVAPFAAAGVFGCASSGSGGTTEYLIPATVPALSPTSRVYDGMRLTRMGAQTAWDALRLLAPHYRLYDRDGGTVGVGSGIARGAPRIVLDGHVLPDADLLRSIPAREIIAVQIMSSIEASTLFGPTRGPVIVVQTLASFRRR